MDERDDGIDEARAATITANIDRAFAFVADAIDDPAILDRIPNGSRLVIREAQVGGQHLRLAAYRPEASDRWGARVTGRVGAVDVSDVQLPAPPIAPEILATTGNGADADEALSDLRAKLDATVRREDREQAHHSA